MDDDFELDLADLPEHVQIEIHRRAAENGRSVEDEVNAILCAALGIRPSR